MPELKTVTIYTDGACTGNPGPGGYGVVLLYKGHRKELSGGFARTTNNRMELLAAIKGLELLKEQCDVALYTDSQYMIDGITKGWAQRWRSNNWQRDGEPVTNHDLWQKLLNLCNAQKVTFNWVKGHSGIAENERCDELARQAANGRNLSTDEGYKGQSAAVLPEKTPGNAAKSNAKITVEGQPCRKCGTPVVKKTPKRVPLKPEQTYYYDYYLLCPGCNTMYTVEEAKVPVERPTLGL
jgi:ribonuclease HI